MEFASLHTPNDYHLALKCHSQNLCDLWDAFEILWYIEDFLSDFLSAICFVTVGVLFASQTAKFLIKRKFRTVNIMARNDTTKL